MSNAKSDRERDAFTRGYMCACAGLARDHGEDTLAEYLMGEAGFTIELAKRVKLDPYDLEPLSLALNQR
jgi:hypothetical protein